MLRDYQQAAFDAGKDWLIAHDKPAVIGAATGAGKSHIVAALAEWVSVELGGKVLCIQPSKELVQQNHAKYLLTGEPASIYCASLGKSLRHPVVFGSPQSIKNSIKKFKNFKLVIVDECHGITPTIKQIITELGNPRVIGLTATPYRMGTGYIYQYDINGQPVSAIDPYFHQLVYDITARDLISRCYLTPPTTEQAIMHYDTLGIDVSDAKEVERATTGQGRKTAAIVQDIVDKSRDRLGVIIFASSIRHADEVMESLPLGTGEVITGKTKKRERDRIINQFKCMKFKYLVNVAVLTTGFDAPHVDVVAILRPTDSASLLQQIVGRGLRLHEGKSDCLVLDYAENIERHCPDGDIFSPAIRTREQKKGKFEIDAKCPQCSTINVFGGRPNPDEFEVDEYGYFVDLTGEQLEIPAHYGRRCLGQDRRTLERCDYRWTTKECPECGADNDIAARVCTDCGCEIVDPNEKLRLEFARIKKDPYSVSTDAVLSWNCKAHRSNAGNLTVRIDFVTEYRTVTAWYMPQRQRLWNDLSLAVFGKICPSVELFIEHWRTYGTQPTSITASKDKQSGFFVIQGHNRPVDIDPSMG